MFDLMTTTLKADAKGSGTFTIGGDLTVHRLGFGAMRVTGEGVWGDPKDPKEARAVLKRVVELGIDFIDTADSYGPETSELLIAEVLKPYKKVLVIATKGGLTRPGPGAWEPVGRAPYIQQCVEMSLRRLRLERIDLWQLHRFDPKTPMEETLGVLKKMQEQGKIRHIGLSEVTVDEIRKARKHVTVVSVQNLYNLGDRKHEDVVDYCTQEKIAFIPWFPMAAGDLAKPGTALDRAAKRHGASVSQLALAWLLHRSPVMLPIPGTSSVKHLEQNTAAASLKLSEAEWKEIEKAAK
jgi:pyridoxine 4-dehydrogenase